MAGGGNVMNEWETNREKVEALMKEAVVVRLALCDGQNPYIVPVNFGFGDDKLYFHSGNKGTKVAILENHPQVAFELDAGVEVVRREDACKWSMKYRSIAGTGTARLLTDETEKKKGLDLLMAHHAPEGSFSYSDQMMSAVNVYEITVSSLRYRETDG
jgi:uncharacterized protein